MGRNDRPAEFLVIFDQALARIEHGQISESMNALKPSASVGRLVRNMALPRSILDKLWALRLALAECLNHQAHSANRPRDRAPSVLTRQIHSALLHLRHLINAGDRVYGVDSNVKQYGPDENGVITYDFSECPRQVMRDAIDHYFPELETMPRIHGGRPPGYIQAAHTLLDHILAVDGTAIPLRDHIALAHALFDELFARYGVVCGDDTDCASRHIDAIIRARKRRVRQAVAKPK